MLDIDLTLCCALNIKRVTGFLKSPLIIIIARHFSRRKHLKKEKELKRSERISLAIAVAPIICIVLEFVFKLFAN